MESFSEILNREESLQSVRDGGILELTILEETEMVRIKPESVERDGEFWKDSITVSCASGGERSGRQIHRQIVHA